MSSGNKELLYAPVPYRGAGLNISEVFY